MSSNYVELSGQLIESKPLRYTPAGIPVLEFIIEHQSSVIESGVPRQVTFSALGMAIGEIALSLQQQALGQELALTGFLATSKKGSSRLRFHIQSYRLANHDLR